MKQVVQKSKLKWNSKKDPFPDLRENKRKKLYLKQNQYKIKNQLSISISFYRSSNDYGNPHRKH